MKVRLLGAHNTESANTRLSGVLIDGVLALDAGGLTSSLSFPEQYALKAVLLTHQHYDHIRDLPALAINLSLARKAIDIYTTPEVAAVIKSNLFDGSIYYNYLEHPPEKPAIKLHVIKPLRPFKAKGYSAKAVPVKHSSHAVGYEVSSSPGETLFYTGDTGPGMGEVWPEISPQLLITETTASNRFAEFAGKAGHFAPRLLREELAAFRELKGYLPRVVCVHMSPGLESEIITELDEVARELKADIRPGHEGMEIELQG